MPADAEIFCSDPPLESRSRPKNLDFNGALGGFAFVDLAVFADILEPNGDLFTDA